jgi:uncharacterized protein YecE (DUF72 family)
VSARAYIGTSGWSYDAWREVLYGGKPRAQWLRLYAQRFGAVEVNATFYHLLRRSSFERWRADTPARFRFAIKGNRYLTHNRKLRAPLAPVRLERERAAGLGAKLAVVLWQLPRTLGKDLARLERFARALRAWKGVRHAIEFRHPSWFCGEVADHLCRHGIAACQSHAADWPLWNAVTTDLVYVRLHGRPVTYASPYGERALRAWAAKVRRWLAEGREVHVYFDNTDSGNAPRNAARLIELVRLATRTPACRRRGLTPLKTAGARRGRR